MLWESQVGKHFSIPKSFGHLLSTWQITQQSKVRLSLHTSQVAIGPALISRFCSMKRLQIFLLPPLDLMLVNRRVTPQHQIRGLSNTPNLSRFVFGFCDLTNRKSIREPYSFKSTPIVSSSIDSTCQKSICMRLGKYSWSGLWGWVKNVVDSSQFNRIDTNRFPCCRFVMPEVDLGDATPCESSWDVTCE